MRPEIPVALCALFALALLSSACAWHGPGDDIRTLGFLEDYSELKPGREGQASLIYIDGASDFSAYSAMLIDPVAALEGPDGESADSARPLAQRFDDALRRELSLEFDLVEGPRTGAFRMRAALARSGDSHLVLEVELLDSATDHRVVGAVDHRALAPAAGSGDVIDDWAVLIRNRLATLRQFDSAARAREAGALEGPANP